MPEPMSRPLREDEPGAWHHVMNRALGRRSLFDGALDYRRLLALLAREVRRGRLEVHAYCLMRTHFHLLIRSPAGAVAQAMRDLGRDYTVYFNRRRGRDGPIFRGRFRSKRIRAQTYRRTVLRYVDDNPVGTALVGNPVEYPWGSAQAYARRRGPPWLTRGWVELEIARRLRVPFFEPGHYSLAARVRLGPGSQAIPDLRLASRARRDPLDEGVHRSPAHLLRWLDERARLADGAPPVLPLVPSATLDRLLTQASRREPLWAVPSLGRRSDPWLLLAAGLHRDLAMATWSELGRRLRRSASGAHLLYGRHAELLATEDGYRCRVADLGRRAIRITFAVDEPRW